MEEIKIRRWRFLNAASAIALILATAGCVTSAAAQQYWDGSSLASNGGIDGGTGTWNAANTSWTDQAGSFNAAWARQGAVFSTSMAGYDVTVAGTQTFTGLTFLDAARYNFTPGTGGAFMTNTAATTVDVQGAGNQVAIGLGIDGTGGLVKTGSGTLRLTAANSYGGGTAIKSGQVEVSATGGLGSGPVTIAGSADAGLLFKGTASGTVGAGNLVITNKAGRFNGMQDIQIGGLQFAGYSSADRARIDNSGQLMFLGTASAGDATITNKTGGTVRFYYNATASNATIINSNVVRFAHSSSAGNATIINKTGGALRFYDTTTAAGAKVVNEAGGTLDASQVKSHTRHANGIFRIGSLSGAGRVVLDTQTLELGGLNRDDAISGIISGTFGSSLVKVGTGTLTLSGANTYTGGTTVKDGTLRIAADTNLGRAPGSLILEGATLHTTANLASSRGVMLAGTGTFLTNSGTTLALSGPIAGTGLLTKDGAGTLLLTGPTAHGGGIRIRNGTLAIGAGGGPGSLAGSVDIAAGATLSFNRLDRPSFAGSISGAGSIQQNGSGTMTLLTGDSSGFTGTTSVNAGTLRVGAGAMLGGALVVNNGGVLDGAGAIGGAVTVADGGTLSGGSDQTLTMASLALSGRSTVDLELAAPSSARLFDVTGNLTLDGTLNIRNAGGFGAGVYRLFDYGGRLTDNGLALGALPASTTGVVQTSQANQVNLVTGNSRGDRRLTPASPTSFWNGTTTAPIGRVAGGSGIWRARSTSNWTDANGTSSQAWNGEVAIFQGGRAAPNGTVQVDAGAGRIATTRMQFIGKGWTMAGDAVSLEGTGGSTAVRVGDGSAASVNDHALVQSALAGASRLVKDDLGTLILTGANSYTGGTTISAGTLQIGNGGTTGSISGNVTNNGTLAFNRSDDQTFAGEISGAGDLAKYGTGTLTLSGNNSYAGSTAINGGTVRVESNTAFGTGTVTTNGTVIDYANGVDIANRLIINSNHTQLQVTTGTATHSGAIDEAGGARPLEKTGAGSLILSGVGNHGGITTVSAGSLIVTGSIAHSAVMVESGAILGGGGIVGGVAARSGSTVAPGSMTPFTTLSVAGDVSFAPGSTYRVAVDAAGQSDRIAASGRAALSGGTVQVLSGTGHYQPSTRYTLLTAAGGVSGGFSQLSTSSDLVFLTPSLSYDANNVYLGFAQTLTPSGTPVSFASVAQTPNQATTATGVQALDPGSPLHGAVLNQNSAGARQAFDALSGEVHASAKSVLIDDSRLIRQAGIDRIRAAFDAVGASRLPVLVLAEPASQASPLPYAAQDRITTGPMLVPATTQRFALWGQGFGSWGRSSSDGNAAALSRSTGGFLAGADATLFDDWRLGLLAGYSRTSFETKRRVSTGDSDNYHLGLYGGTQWGALGLRAGAAYSWHDLSTTRSASFPGFGGTLHGNYDAGTAQIFGELGYGVTTRGFGLEPFANLAYVSQHADHFSERGGAAALTGNGGTQGLAFTTLGLRLSGEFTLAGLDGSARGLLGWRHAIGDVAPRALLSFAGASLFSVAGIPISKDALVLEAGLDLAISKSASLGLSYAGQLGNGAASQSVKGSLAVRF